MKEKDIYKRILVNFLLTLIGVVVLALFLDDVLRFFLPFVIGFVIAAIANPMVRFLEKRVKVKRKYGSAIIIVLVLAAVVAVIYAIGYFLVRELIDLIGDIPNLLTSAQGLVEELSDKLYGVYERLPEDVQTTINNLTTGVSGWLENAVANFKMPSISKAGNYVGSFIEGLLIGIIAILAAYFIIADRDELVAMVKRIVPESVQEYYGLVVSNIKSAVGGYFKAQFKIMLIIIVILFIGFEALGVNYSFLLALLTAFLDLLPVLGTGTIIGPWVVVDIITGKYVEAVVLTVLYLVCQVTKQLLQPKMVGDSIGMNPLATLLFMFVGYRFGGILGMIIGIPVGMILVNFYRIGIFDRLIRGFKILANSINEYRKY